MPNKKGFTLIELLVVISIIALLSSIILAAVSDTRARAKDARIKAELINLRNAAGLYYANKGDYLGTDTAHGLKTADIMTKGCSQGFMNDTTYGGKGIAYDLSVLTRAIVPYPFYMQCAIDANSFVVFVRLETVESIPFGSTGYICIDGTEKIKTTGHPAQYTLTSPYSCP